MLIGNANYLGPDDLPLDLPLFPLSGALLLPRAGLPLTIFEPRYLSMVDAVLGGHRLIGIVQPRFDLAPAPADASRGPLCAVGCAGRLTGFAEVGDGRYQITLTGVARFAIREERPSGRLYRVARVEAAFPQDFRPQAGEAEVDRDDLLAAFRAYLDAHDLEADWDSVLRTPTEQLVNSLSIMSPYGPAEKQALLEAADLATRAATLVALTERALAREGGPSTLN